MVDRKNRGVLLSQVKEKAAPSRLILPAMLGLLLCMGVAVFGQDETALLNRLGSDDASVREQAQAALVQKGPSMLAPLFDRMDGKNKTANLWAWRTAETIVYRSTRPGAKKEQAAAEKALLQVVQGNCDPRTKRSAFELISVVGRRDSVRVLARKLGDPKDREMARWALERIPEKSATKALVRGISKTQEPQWKAALFGTLAARGDATARSAILKALRDSNETIRLAAIDAAGRIPASKTEAALWRIWHDGTAKEKPAATDALLHLAETYVRKGRNRTAESIYLRLSKEVSDPLLRCAAFSGLAQVGGKKSMPDLVAALCSDDLELRGAIEERLIARPGEDLTRMLVEALQSAGQGRCVGLVRVLAQRHDSSLTEAVPLLLQVAKGAVKNDNEELAEAAASVLGQISGTATTRAVIDTMKGSSPQLQALCLRVLGNQAGRDALPIVLRSASSPNSDVRIEALRALRRLGDSRAAPALRAALKEDNQAIKDAAAESALFVAGALNKAGRKEEAINLCIAAAHATSKTDQLKQLMDRLRGFGATKQLADLAVQNGCIGYWWVAGPFPNREKLLRWDAFPTDQPVDISQPVKANGKEYTWKAVRVYDPLGRLDLVRTLGPIESGGCYLYAEVESDRDQDVLFKIGSNDDVFCWLNGEKAHEFIGGRLWEADQDEAQVRLKKGTNRVLLKVLNQGGGWAASLRITNLAGKALPLPQRR